MLLHLLAQSNIPAAPADSRGQITNLIIWLFIGLVAGFLGSKIVNKRGDGIMLDIILGLIGSFVGGFLFNLLGINSGGTMIMSIVVATIGAVVVLVIYHKLIHSPRAA
jgi:uncharacterized membrane protein YeaQ/YmgE (transglycosylase-associated protein family)